MYTVEFVFGSKAAAIRERAVCAAVGYLVALNRGGQLQGKEWPLARANGAIRAYGSIPERTALRKANECPQVESARSKLMAAGLAGPEATVVGRDPEATAACTCRWRRGYVVYTRYRSTESPLWCADCFRPVPLYRIPFTSGPDGYNDLMCWQRDYQACDTLQMACGFGERFGYTQMSVVDSALTHAGLDCCRNVRRVTERPCYYYLYRYREHPAADERTRRCPSCGRRWRLRQLWHGKFDFRCDRCHLLSNTSE